MTLGELRQLITKHTGRYDLVNADGSDNGIDYYINEAVRLLDLTVDSNGTLGYTQARVYNGDVIVPLGKRVRSVLSAFVFGSDGKKKLTIIRRLGNMLELLKPGINNIDKGVPKYAYFAGPKMHPDLVTVFNDAYEHGSVGSNMSDELAQDWLFSSQIGHEVVDDAGTDVMQLTNNGVVVGEFSTSEPYLYRNEDASKPMILKFWAKGINSYNKPYVTYMGEIEEIAAPSYKPYYQLYVYKLSPIEGIKNGIALITIYPFGHYGITDYEPDGAIVMLKGVELRQAHVLLVPELYSPSSGSVLKAQNNLLVYPPADSFYRLELFGRMYSEKLVLDEDSNYWTDAHPNLVKLAVAFLLEADLRNSQGLVDWDAAMQPYIKGIQSDYYDSQLDELNEMEG